MARYPAQIRTELKHSPRVGLFAAVSDDLPGLMVVGKTIEEVEQRVAGAIADLIEAEYGEKVIAHSLPDDGDEAGFKSLAEPRILELNAA